MAMIHSQLPAREGAGAAQAAVPADPPSRARMAANIGRKLLADLSEYLARRRRQQHGGLYLPLVRIDGGE